MMNMSRFLTTVADDEYIRRSILEPSAEIVAGFASEMPSYQGLLGEGDLDAIVMFLRSLSEE